MVKVTSKESRLVVCLHVDSIGVSCATRYGHGDGEMRAAYEY